jgi:thioredoxin 1
MLQATLSQCPCSGGGSGGDSSGIATLLTLAAVIGVWLLARSIWKKKGVSTMDKVAKITIVVVLAAAVVGVIVIKNGRGTATPQRSVKTLASGLPRLVDLGSTTCIPCKMMAPILEELKKEYAGRMQVEFIDVNVDAKSAKQFGIKLIPTQVFIDASGKELWRHEGFISKQDILAKWKELGVSFAAAPVADSQSSDQPVNSERK